MPVCHKKLTFHATVGSVKTLINRTGWSRWSQAALTGDDGAFGVRATLPEPPVVAADELKMLA